jgi:hypothetical protein
MKFQTAKPQYHLEQIIPTSLGGNDDPENLPLACPTCNAYKSNYVLGMDDEGIENPLFHPRRDRWDDHFEFDAATYQVRGKTTKGRSTVNRLWLNAAMQVLGRKYWVELELYP